MSELSDAQEHVPNAVAVELKIPALEVKIRPGDAV